MGDWHLTCGKTRRSTNLFRACKRKGVSYHPLHVAETQRQTRERESFIVGEGWEGIGGYWPGGSGDGLYRTGRPK